MKIIETKRFVYSVEETEEGRLNLCFQYPKKINGQIEILSKPVDDPGRLIRSLGGVVNILRHCIDVDIREYFYVRAQRTRIEKADRKRRKQEYLALQRQEQE